MHHASWRIRGEPRSTGRRQLIAVEAIQGPAGAVPLGNLIYLRTGWRGPEAALRLLDRMPADHAGVDRLRAYLLVNLGRLDEAWALVDALEAKVGAAESSVASLAPVNAGVDPALLRAVGREDLARQRAQEILANANQEFARGNRAPQVRTAFIEAEIVLGRRESALAALREWREEAQRIPSDYQRMMEFNDTASQIYALLGRADESVALLRELQANGFRWGYGVRHDRDFDAIRHDPRLQKLVQEEETWVRTLPDPTDL